MDRDEISRYRQCQANFGTLNDKAVDKLLDAAESELRLRESIAITDRNFRAMQNERDELRDKLRALVDVLLPLAEIAEVFDVNRGNAPHKDGDDIHAWHVTDVNGNLIERTLTVGMLRAARDVLAGVK